MNSVPPYQPSGGRVDDPIRQAQAARTALLRLITRPGDTATLLIAARLEVDGSGKTAPVP